MTSFPFRLTTGLAALAACITLSSCETTKKTGYENVVDYTSPNSKLSEEEFPFDEAGNYREDWAARGAGASGVQDRPTDTALYTQSSDSSPSSHPAYAPEPGSTRTASTASRSTASRSTASRSTASRSTASRSTASRSAASKPKPKPKPKPVAKPTYVKVQSGDTLYGISKRTGVSIAAIKAANGLKSDIIVDGKTLKIPKKK